MSIKIFNKTENRWIPFPGSIGADGWSAYEIAVKHGYKGSVEEWLESLKGKDAYTIAVENGYSGTEEEYNKILADIPKITDKVTTADEVPTENSSNLVISGGVWQSIKTESTNLESKINTNTESINSINSDISSIRNQEISDKIKSSIIDNLTSSAVDKALSANQGKVLKTLIDNLTSVRIEIVEELPSSGEVNVIYLVKKSEEEATDVYDEYIFVENKWEKIGNTNIDLSNYYTKNETYNKEEIDSKIPDIELNIEGDGNVITSLNVDSNNKHKVNGSKEISVYTKQEIDDNIYTRQQVDEKFSGAGLGDVLAEAPFTTADRVIVSNGAGKTIKDSGILIGNLALKTYVDDKEITWDKVTGKPSTYTPSEHTHSLSQITDAGALASKDKVDEEDLNFSIPEEIVIDSELSETSTNPVQNKVINEALSGKVNSSTLDNYYNKTETEEKIDEKIAGIGGGNVTSSENLVNNEIILGAGVAAIKTSGISLSSLSTNLIPTTFNNTTANIKAGYIYYPVEGGATEPLDIINNHEDFSIEKPDTIIYSKNKISFNKQSFVTMSGLDDLEGSIYIYCLSFIPLKLNVPNGYTGVVVVNGMTYNDIEESA